MNSGAPKDFEFRAITLTTQYDPSNPNDVTIDALRERVAGLNRAVSHLWRCGLRDAKDKRKRRRRGTGLHVSIEMGLRGNVHAHLIYFGPYVPKRWLLETAAEVYDRIGVQSRVRRIERDDLRSKVREAIKYVFKGVSPLCERWFVEAREVTHPRLLARWETAIEGRHVHSTFGSFREKVEEDAAPTQLSDSDVTEKPAPCPFCGSTARRVLTEVDTMAWVKHCHGLGHSAFRGTRVPPSVPIPIADWDAFIARMNSAAPNDGTEIWREFAPRNDNVEREVFVI